MALEVKLVVVGGDVKTAELKVRLPSVIGRGRGTNVVLPHPLVSRQHCELFEVDGHLMVRDLGSLNGTFVNNQRITESPLPPGELLTVGTVTFRAIYEADEARPVTAVKGAGPSDKTLPASKAPTIKAGPKEAAAAHSDSEVLEFNFDQPLMPEDEDEPAAASPSHPTERLSQTTQQPRGEGAPARGKGKGSAADDVTVRVEGEGEDDAPSESDDDLDDFLKSLGGGS